MKRIVFALACIAALSSAVAEALADKSAVHAADRPNVLWIVVEDASPHIGCYGEKAIKTPNLDNLSAEGIRFENAMITAPVCSPARSALITGMYQTTICAHNHRSCSTTKKASGNTAYYPSYKLPAQIPMISHLFRKAGYYTSNGYLGNSKMSGKTDYNFIADKMYDGVRWQDSGNKPFFAQIQLRGGKSRPNQYNGGAFKLPPYYPGDPEFTKDWEGYLASWEKTDQEVGQIIKALKDAGVYDNTLIIFITDHGISHIRGKQYLYEEGIRIPMIVRFPDKKLAGTVRKDLAVHIDMAPISLAAAGLPVPVHLQGKDVFAKDYKPRDMVFGGRDRCDETIEILRSVRTPKYKYIRNFLSYRPHMQYNQYKEGKGIVKKMKSLHKAGKLNELQSRFFTVPRPTEELYDLEADPYEINNLAGTEKHKGTAAKLRKALYEWMVETGDPGLIPEPILEDLGKKHGSKFAAMAQPQMKTLVPKLISVIEAGERKDLAAVRKSLGAEAPAERYWAATWAGVNLDKDAMEELKKLADDPIPALQVAASLSLCQLGQDEVYFPKLVNLINNPNLIVGMYAMNAIEQSEIRDQRAAKAAQTGKKNRYEFTKRYAKRLATLTRGKR